MYVAISGLLENVASDPESGPRSWRESSSISSNDISAYTVNGTTGALTHVAGSLAARVSPQSVKFDPSGKFVYAANFTECCLDGIVSGYAINAATDALTSIGTDVATGRHPSSITTTGRFP